MKNVLVILLVCLCTVLLGQSKKILKQLDADKSTTIQKLDSEFDRWASISREIWEFSEVGYQEYKSSKLLQDQLTKAGFEVSAGVADIPTAFIATWGSGETVMGILAEYDALPGLSQADVPMQQSIENKNAGHGCGHNLFGTASVAAGIAIKEWMQANNIDGQIRVYGTPAEEGGSGKVYMVREGLFDDVDAVLHWHPSSGNGVTSASSLANKTGKFRFYGKSAHAAGAPEQGRSALDAVEAMNFMANMMREHVPERTRIHYVITKGGDAPNVVPNFAEVYFYIRHPEMEEVRQIWDRLVKIAEGAALGTETRMEYEITGGVYNMMINETLAEVMQKNLERVGGYEYNEGELAFAKKIQETIDNKAPLTATSEIRPLESRTKGGGSTDVSDVSWTVPTVGLRAATYVPGTPSHSWQAVACTGMSIGQKGMMIAAKTMAITGMELFLSPEVLQKAMDELVKSRGEDFVYEAMIGEREPALDYRN